MLNLVKVFIYFHTCQIFVKKVPLGQFSEQSLETCHQKWIQLWNSSYKIRNLESELYGERLLACLLQFNVWNAQQATMAYQGGGLATSNFYTFYGIQIWQISQNLLIHLVPSSTYTHLLIKLTFNIPKKGYLRNIIILITCINKCINITLSMCGILYHYHYRH